MLAGYISIVVMSSVVKILSPTVPPNEILFFRFSIGLLFSLGLVIASPRFDWRIHDLGASALRNGAGIASMLLMFYSLKHLPLSTAMLLNNTSAFFVPLFMLVLFKQKVSWPTLACTAVGFVGICIILYTPHGDIDMRYLFAAILSAMLAALAYLGIKSLSRNHSPVHIIFYFYLSGTLVLLFTVADDWVLPSWHEAALLGLVGVFGFGFQMFVTKAFALTNVAHITPFVFLSVILSVLADWLIWNTAPGAGFWLGAAVTLASLRLLSGLKKTDAPAADPSR